MHYVHLVPTYLHITKKLSTHRALCSSRKKPWSAHRALLSFAGAPLRFSRSHIDLPYQAQCPRSMRLRS